MGRLIDSLTRLKETVWGEGKKENELDITETKGSTEKTLSRKDKRNLAKQEKKLQEELAAEESGEEDSEDESFDLTRLQESDSEEEYDDDKNAQEDEDEEDGEEEEDEEDDIPLSDVELDEDADVVPHQKETINNRPALKAALSSFALPKSLKFVEHMSITSDAPLVLKDMYDDMERELAFYQQALTAANLAKKLCKKEFPFSRPTDYFAEMVKSDEHMDKLKQKLIDDETAKKASQEARRQRELKKFGKKVQHVKLQERQKDKRETMDKIKSLKRKRANNEMTTEDFDIALEETADLRPSKGAKRQAKDSKYGRGGQKRFKNKNDAESSADMSGFNSKKMKSGGSKPVKRPGRSRRHNRR